MFTELDKIIIQSLLTLFNHLQIQIFKGACVLNLICHFYFSIDNRTFEVKHILN